MVTKGFWITALLLLTSAQVSLAQAPRDYSGWSTPTAAPSRAAARNPQVAKYQAQGSLGDGLPQLPMPEVGSFDSTSSALPSVLPEDLPAILPASNSPVSPPPMASTSSSVLPPAPDARTTGQSVLPPQPAPRQPVPQGTSSRGGQRMPNTVNNDLRPSNAARPEPRFDNVAYQSGNGPTVSETGAAGMRTVPGGQSRGGGALDPRAVTTGLPFVTPPPRGRYPTSYYNPAFFQNAAFQRQVAARQLAGQSELRNQPVGQLASNVTANPNGALLPQYSQPGIYPTAYQQCVPTNGSYAPTLPPPPNMPQTGAVPGSVVPPTYTPNLTPGMYAPNNAGYSPLVSLGQENYNVVLGRGFVGQPTVYVPGQPIRNFLRYLSP